MRTVLYDLSWLYSFTVIFALIWFYPRFRCWLSAFGKQPHLYSAEKRRLCILIPARNESRAITPLLESLRAQTYPKDRFDVQVIVADPDDPTIGIASKFGMRTHVIADQTCKSDALDGCLQTLLSEDRDRYDAYLIIDADCVIDERYLEEMNNALASGRDIVTSKKVVKNYFFGDRKSQTLSACCNGIIWTLLDNMGNRYKSEHGYPCFLVGTGLMLTKRVVHEIGGWPYKETMTEDVEFLHDSVLHGFSTFFYEYAILYMEEADRLSVTNKRRKRWMTGVVDSERLYGRRVRKKIWSTPSLLKGLANRYYTSALHPAYLLLGASALYSGLMLLFSVFLFFARDPLWRTATAGCLHGFLVIYLSLLVMTAIAIACDRKWIKLSFFRKLVLLFVHPIFYMDYILIVARAFFSRRERTWEVIDRVDFGSAADPEEADAEEEAELGNHNK